MPRERMEVYRQSFPETVCRLTPTEKELEDGVAWIFCRECGGTGSYHGPAFVQRCNACKGKGTEPVSL